MIFFATVVRKQEESNKRAEFFFFLCKAKQNAKSLVLWVFVALLCKPQHFKLLVEDLQVKGEGNIKKAMKESFWVLNEVSIKHLQLHVIYVI